jgi:hypothetical protein
MASNMLCDAGGFCGGMDGSLQHRLVQMVPP